MLKLKITNDDDVVLDYDINNYSLEEFEKGHSWRLKFINENDEISYIIHEDSRETFATVRVHIEELIDTGEINIREYLSRNYIFIGGSDGNERQFSAQREQ